jgi:cytoskeletal protein CcmA (bactofilin family)
VILAKNIGVAMVDTRTSVRRRRKGKTVGRSVRAVNGFCLSACAPSWCINIELNLPNQDGGSQLSKIYDDLKQAEYSRHGGNVVGPGLRIKGELSGNDNLLVEGIVEGPIRLGDGVLTVAPRGKVNADVVSREIVVYGELKGNLAARERIEIKKEGSVVGGLTTSRIVIEDGAQFKGSIEIIRAAEDAETPARASAAAASSSKKA